MQRLFVLFLCVIATALAEGPPTLEQAIRGLQSDDDELSLEAFEALQGLAEDQPRAVVEALAPLLADRSHSGEVCRAALEILGEIGPAAATALPELLEVYAEDDDLGLNKAADEALAAIGVGDGSAFLAVIQRGGPEAHRWHKERIVFALRELEPGQALNAAPALIEVLACPYSPYVRAASDCLRLLGPEVKPQLLAVLAEDSRSAVRTRVIWLLGVGDLGPPAEVLPVLRARQEWAWKASQEVQALLDALGAGRSPKSEALTLEREQLEQEAEAAATATVRLYVPGYRRYPSNGKLKPNVSPADLLEALEPALVHSAPPLRAAAVAPLVLVFAQDPERLAPALVRALGDEDAEVRRTVAASLTLEIAAHPCVFAALLAGLDDSDPKVRERSELLVFNLGERWKDEGDVRLWVVPRAYWVRLTLLGGWLFVLFYWVAWLRSRGRLHARPARAALLVTVASAPLSGWVVYGIVSRRWTQGFLPDTPLAFVSFPVAATLTAAVCCAFGAGIAAFAWHGSARPDAAEEEEEPAPS